MHAILDEQLFCINGRRCAVAGNYTKGYKFRLYPTKTQATLLNKTLGCCRFVFNHFLSVRRDSWENEKKSVSYNETSALMTQLKSDENYLWLKEVDSVALQQSLRDLDTSYQNFFNHVSRVTERKTTVRKSAWKVKELSCQKSDL